MITCLDYASGRPLWEHRIAAEQNVAHVSPSVLVDDGQVLVGSGRQLFGFSLEDGTPQWSAPFRSGANGALGCGLALPDLTVHADRR